MVRPVSHPVLGSVARVVVSAYETAAEVAETLARKQTGSPATREGTSRFLTTGDPHAFREQGRRFLQLPIAEVEHVNVAELEGALA